MNYMFMNKVQSMIVCVCIALEAASAIDSPYHSFLVRQKRKGASEVRWLKTVLSSGTLSDKMAALTLLVQVSGSDAGNQ